MTDITEKTENGELVTNRDQLVVVDNIEPLIKIIRGQQVMLDRDLATLYGVETKRLNEQVKRNIKRFRRNRQTLWGGCTDANPKLSLNDT